MRTEPRRRIVLNKKHHPNRLGERNQSIASSPLPSSPSAIISHSFLNSTNSSLFDSSPPEPPFPKSKTPIASSYFLHFYISEDVWQNVLQTAMSVQLSVNIYVIVKPVRQHHSPRHPIFQNYQNYPNVSQEDSEFEEADEEDDTDVYEDSEGEPCRYFAERDGTVPGQSDYDEDLGDGRDSSDEEDVMEHMCPEWQDISVFEMMIIHCDSD